ncbi:DUF4747 family protein [Psychrobacter faecalis]
MARMKTIKISGLNIVSQPHSPQQYVEIFERIRDSQLSFPVLGEVHLKLVNISAVDGVNLINGIKGEILKYSNIDKDSAWVNTDKGSELTPEQTPNIPNNSSPNGNFFDFVFYPQHEINNHKLFYISQYWDSVRKKSRSLSPNLVARFFTGIFQDNSDFQNFESIEVTVLPSQSALNEVLSLEVVKNLEIFIKAPNPDDFAEVETRILHEMQITHVSKKLERFTYDGESIELDEEMRNDARVASTNGYVKVRGENAEGKIEERSTTNIPLREPVIVDADAPNSGFFALLRFLFTSN